MTIEDYILQHSDQEDDVLQELNRETHLKVLMPRMLSGTVQGKLLEFISRMIKPMNILELGTFTGYSAICLAKGLQKEGKLDTIELNDELENIIKKYLKKAEIEDKVEVFFGNTDKIIPTLYKLYDLVFMDADKRRYLADYKLVFEKVKPGGFILADNVLWDGKVIKTVDSRDEYTKGILEFNEFVKNDSRVEKFILPIRDGLMLIRKK